MNEHDVLVWGPAGEGERTASGRTVAAGWVWSCSCGAWDDGYPDEDAADYGADGDHSDPNKRVKP